MGEREKEANEQVHTHTALEGATTVGTGARTCNSWHVAAGGCGCWAHGEGAPRQGGRSTHDVQGWPTSTWGHSSLTHAAEGPGRGGSQAHRRKRQTHGGRARKTEVNRNKTEVESHLGVTEPESRRDGSQCHRGNKIPHTEKPPVQREGATQMASHKETERRNRTEWNRRGTGVDSARTDTGKTPKGQVKEKMEHPRSVKCISVCVWGVAYQ